MQFAFWLSWGVPEPGFEIIINSDTPLYLPTWPGKGAGHTGRRSCHQADTINNQRPQIQPKSYEIYASLICLFMRNAHLGKSVKRLLQCQKRCRYPLTGITLHGIDAGCSALAFQAHCKYCMYLLLSSVCTAKLAVYS